ncbi:hypothetical protein K440DRAFT_647833 [Wilcoxina mikolae CBS 423.85]|nr:hypothetical protein K440DRAFT_647833 [Wilcoxina mikolae CBS 423.85]
MPGIIPMKLIKCGSSQTRIAQACDRCRSKKIRCDGVRPCCSQCANVGFECKTSDKLSRRAFPRGYTESLEERVRSLEREVRELKDLLDAKDEQLEMVSKIYSFSPYSPPASTSSGTMRGTRKSPESFRSGRSASVEGDEIITIGEPTRLISVDGRDGLYMGASSGRTFVDTVKQRMEETGQCTVEFETEQFFQGQSTVVPDSLLQPDTLKAPPRLLSDHLLVSYFQEYHPLFPVLHRPTFLSTYEKLVAVDSAAAASLPAHDIAKLFLVFAIALQQQEPRNSPDQQSFDFQWQRALDSVVSETSINTVQCLVLAQLYCFGRGDYAKLLHYKNLAVGVALRLGLNHSQRKFAVGALGGEMRKRAFWCVYCLDSFSAAMLGLPKLLREDDIDAEYPSDIDDEYVSEEGFLPTLPGDSTKISSALALFRGSRVLAQVLDVEYSTAACLELSYSRLRDLEEELDAWKAGLAPHLRMEFVNGTPATNIVHSRSPLLVLAYHYIRTLIHRPLISSNLPHHSSAALVAVRDSSKCIVQIMDLLTERGLGFAFCLNKAQVLLLAGFTFIYSAMESQRDGVLAKENQKLLSVILAEMGSINMAQALSTVASSVISSVSKEDTTPATSTHTIQAVSPLSSGPSSSPEIQHSTVRRTISSVSAKIRKSSSNNNARRPSLPHDFGSGADNLLGTGILSRVMSSSMMDLHSRSLHRQTSPSQPAKTTILEGRHSISYDPPNLDFLWGIDPTQNVPDSPSAPQSAPHSAPQETNVASADDWERMLAMMDAQHAAHIYGDSASGYDNMMSGAMEMKTIIRNLDQR